MRGLRLFLWLVAAFVWPLKVAQAAGGPEEPRDAAYVDSLVARAQELHLADRREWLRLGHYKSRTFGLRSDADGADFFLAKRGKTDPSAELEATLRGFFEPPNYATGQPPQHPICRFPARLVWLTEVLNIDRSRLQIPKCEKFDEYWKSAAPHSVTLVFSSFFISNPASAFGHTFLRINRDTEPGQTKRQELLDHGVDYSARVDTGNALLYGLKGLVGLFPGTFNMYPYYYKVREYNDFESRDLWEYDLNLTPKQVAMLTAHIWELGSTYLNYYYIDENCSYHILTALEAAVPDIDITSKLRNVVIPADTVRAVAAQKGLVARVRFRPSLRHTFEARISELTDPAMRQLVEHLADNAETEIPAELNLNDDQTLRIFDAAIDLNDIRWAKELVRETDTPGARRKQRLLERRAAIAKPSPALAVAVPWTKAPDLSHGSARFTLSTGLFASTAGAPLLENSVANAFRHQEAKPFYELAWRVAGHDLTDPSTGQSDTARVDFGGITVRFYPAKGRTLKALELTDMTLARIESLTPVDRFTLKPSWKVTAAGFRVRDRGCSRNDCFVVGGGAGGGLALSLFSGHLLTYAMVETLVVASGALSGIADSPVRVDVGPTAGVRLRLNDSFHAMVSGHAGYLPFQSLSSTETMQSTLTAKLARDVAVGFDARLEPRAASIAANALLFY